ncbi:cytohesin-interacting protein [Nothobranchius furzeri]|uniref:Cytohesin 1 interacting protein n=2 Tax=Nothobranchius furzeri TaxID=105023 RepID=A0A9D3BRF8_NOTFU|nr:cytohesin-interacting protein [Nothobranchius furzeri]KAF7215963.1 cytohesin 1 interacting protein [Nothobranchius furzeri]
MNFNGLQRESSQEVQENSLKKKPLWYRRSLRGNTDRHRQNAGTQPRACKPKPTTTSLVDYSDPQRTSTVLEKHDNETFGFEIQTYGLKQKTSSAVEMCTFISKVKEDSVAESAGLTAGDVIITVNGVSIEGLSHELVLNLIRESTNNLKMETGCVNILKQIELEKRLDQLKQSHREKLMELQALTLQEKRLLRGNLNNRSLDLLMEAQAALNSPVVCHGRRFSSDSSYKSGMTDDSDQASVFGELSSPSPGSAISTTDDGCFFSRDFPTQDASKRLSSSSLHHQALSRSSSSSLAGSNTSLSPSWDETRISSLFGTLPRKSRRGTVRQQIFKLIPALQRSVEEEEMATPTQ